MSNHSLTARGTDPPLSHKSVVSITHEQNIICSKTLICRSRGGLSANKKKGKNTSNDNHFYYLNSVFISMLDVDLV